MEGEIVSPDRVRRLAALARLELSDAEVAQVAAELRHLRRALPDLPPGAEAGGEGGGAAPLRPDRVAFDPLLVPPCEVAPAWREGFFVVPRLSAEE